MISSFSIKNICYLSDWEKALWEIWKIQRSTQKKKEWNKWVDIFQKIVIQIILV